MDANKGRIVLLVWAVLFAGLGIFGVVSPASTVRPVALALDTPTAYTEIRAVYGGLQLGFAAFLIFCSLTAARIHGGLVLLVMIFAGLVIGRGAGLILDGFNQQIVIYLLLAIELAGLVSAAYALRTKAGGGGEAAAAPSE